MNLIYFAFLFICVKHGTLILYLSDQNNLLNLLFDKTAARLSLFQSYIAFIIEKKCQENINLFTKDNDICLKDIQVEVVCYLVQKVKLFVSVPR